MAVTDLLLLAAAGLVAGVVNVIAGGGSFLTLPVLIFLGLPAGVANGTNRVALLLQNVGAVSGFARHRVLPWEFARRVAPAAVAGAAVGAWLATRTGDDAFRRILALLMLALTLWTLARRDPAAGAEPRRRATGWLLAVTFFAVGVYGGFIQAGVGFLLLGATTIGGLDLVRGNAVKVFCVLAWTFVTLTIFAWAGRVEWGAGAVMGVGNLAGSQLGVRLTVLRGHVWIRTVVSVTIVLFALRLWFAG